jgi:hypothetical protein
MLYFALIFLLADIGAGIFAVFYLERMFLEGLAPYLRGPRRVGAASVVERVQPAVAGVGRLFRAS